MVAAAVYILKTPCLWAMAPPIFDGPTVFKPSTTYYERAKAYIAAEDECVHLSRRLDPHQRVVR